MCGWHRHPVKTAGAVAKALSKAISVGEVRGLEIVMIYP
jgi:hypothetical protein